jgi:hypothetical protein
MFIPGVLISLVTFPGVIVHELAHVAFCKFTDTRVLKVCLFRLGNPAGYVIHEQPSTVWRHILIGVGPFFVNTFLGLMLGIIAIPLHMDLDHPTLFQVFFLWLGVSIAMHSFPSIGDARSIWHAMWSQVAPISARLIGSPLVFVIFAGAIGSIFWLDVLYGVGVVGAAGALQKTSQRNYTVTPPSASSRSTSDVDVNRLVSVEDIDQTIARMSRKYNADLPRQGDKYTRIDTTIPSHRKLTYLFTVLGVSADDVDGSAFAASLRPSIINGYKTTPQLAILRDHGVELHYVYRDESGKHITEIIVSAKDF